MKSSSRSLLLGLCIALASIVPAQARVDSQQQRASKAKAVAKAKAKAAPRHTARVVKAGKSRRVALRAAVPARPSFGAIQGLHAAGDALALKSSVALVIDQDTNEVLFSKNPSAVLPIASITKLMTGLVVAEAGQPLDEVLTVTQDDVDTERAAAPAWRWARS